MRKQKSIALIIPEPIFTELSGIADAEKENIFYLIHLLLNNSNIDRRIDEENNGFAPINKDKFKDVTGKNAERYIKYLLREKILQRDYYTPGAKSYYHRINPEMINNSFRVWEISGTKVYDNIRAQQRKKQTNINRFPAHLRAMRKYLMTIPYDKENAFKWIQSNTTGAKKISYLIAVSQIADKRFRYFTRNTTNSRLDTNFTNLKTELRQFIKGDFVQIDLKNSQPFLLAWLLSNVSKVIREIINTGVCLNWENLMSTKIERFTRTFGVKAVTTIAELNPDEEIKTFLQWTQSGVFYDNLVNTFGNGATRQDVKNTMFAVLFSRNETYINYQRFEPYAKEKAVFAKIFPKVAKIVEVLKEKEHSRLSIYLQQWESTIFIDGIAECLVTSGIIPITIHDSVIIPANKEHETTNIIHDFFKNKAGILPTFETTVI